MIIDGHQHVYSDISEQVRLNKEYGINKVVLFPTSVHPETAKNKEEFSVEFNRLNLILSGKINPIEARVQSYRELIDAIKKYPDFFIGFGSCPFGLDVNKTAEWINMNIIGNNLKGIGEITIGTGMISALENIFSNVHEINSNLPIWIHTFNPLTNNDIKDLFVLIKKYNKVQYILGHSGGSNWLELIDLSKGYNNVYLDISASFTQFSIKYISESLPDQCVYSSDMPYGDPQVILFQIDKIVKDKSIKENLLWKNTNKLLSIM
jgi:uncharacterized protein